MTTPAGWYVDDKGATRWWDGSRWGEDSPVAAPSTEFPSVPEGTNTTTVWVWPGVAGFTDPVAQLRDPSAARRAGQTRGKLPLRDWVVSVEKNSLLGCQTLEPR